MTRKKSHMAKSSSRGFTLIEIAVVIAISSIMLVSAINLLNMWMRQSALTTSQQRLSTIQEALANYETQYHRLPCPSSFIAKTSDAAFGREVSVSCVGPNNPNGGDTYSATGRTGTNGPNDPLGINKVTAPAVIIGALPVRDLGLPDSYRTNPSGYMYSYAITESEATAPMNGFAGAIDVVDSLGNTVLPLASDTSSGTATYVVVDHGKDGKGAFVANSTTTAVGTPPAIACGTDAGGLDALNCSYVAGAAVPIQFRNAPFSAKPGTSWFDDAIVYNTSLSTSTSRPGVEAQAIGGAVANAVALPFGRKAPLPSLP